MEHPSIRIIHTKPDTLGRVMWTDRHYTETPPYCGECGADPARQCGHYAPCYRGQVFFGKPADIVFPLSGIVVRES